MMKQEILARLSFLVIKKDEGTPPEVPGITDPLMIFIGTLFILLIVFTIVFYFHDRKKKKDKELLEKQDKIKHDQKPG